MASIAPLAVVAACLLTMWSKLPASFPHRWLFNGEPSQWMSKTPWAVFGPVLAGFLIYCYMLCFAVGLPRIRRGTRYVCQVLAPISWLVTIVFSAVASIPLAAAYHLAPGQVEDALLSITALGVLTIASILIPSAVRARQTLSPYSDTPDRGWHAGGLVYYNPADPAIWVDKRMGIGWTLNFARPQSWIVLGSVLATIGGITAVVSLH